MYFKPLRVVLWLFLSSLSFLFFFHFLGRPQFIRAVIELLNSSRRLSPYFIKCSGSSRARQRYPMTEINTYYKEDLFRDLSLRNRLWEERSFRSLARVQLSPDEDSDGDGSAVKS